MVTAAKSTTAKVAIAKKPLKVNVEIPATPLPVVKKAAAKPRVSKAASPKASPKITVSDEQRARYVEVAAFYIAERRGFTAGNPTDDWLAAEAEVNRLIDSGHFPA
jgi:hypothetical protein